MRKQSLEEKEMLNKSEAAEFFQIGERKISKIIDEAEGGDFLVFYKKRPLIIKTAFANYLKGTSNRREKL